MADPPMDLAPPDDGPLPVEERAVHAMGSSAHVVVVGGPPGLVDDALARLAQLESRWSRFRPDSELCRLNARAGTWVPVSADLQLLVRTAVRAREASGGLVDPLVLGAVVAAGYDRSLDDLRAGRPAPVGLPTPPPGPVPVGVHVETGPGVVRLPPGTGLDPGGIGKGLAADVVAAELLAAGALGACVNVGGDLRVAGLPPSGVGGWTVAVEHPGADSSVATVGLTDGGVATSTTRRRRWRADDGERHHLVDPRTGLPSASPLATVTALAASAWQAEVLAKAVLLAGSVDDVPAAAGPRAAVLAVGEDGERWASPGFGAFTSEVAA